MQLTMRLDVINNTHASDHLNLVRGLAATAVLISHVRALFLVNYSSLTTHSFSLSILYFFSGLGHEAVMIFFVLSGYFIGSTVLLSTSTQWRWAKYLTQRLTRLLVVLIPALFFGAIWDLTGIHLFGTEGIYGGHPPCDGVTASAVANHLTVMTALGNLFFLQGIFVPTFGSNGPLWSLNYEFWYYILFPVMVLAALMVLRKSVWAVAYCLLGLLICVLLTLPMLTSFPIWLLGVAVAVVVPYIQRPQLLLLCFAVFFHFCALYLSRVHRFSFEVSDYIVGISFAVLMLSLLTFRGPRRISVYSHFAKWAAGFSYTLYTVHLPFLLFLRALLIPTQERWSPDLRHRTVCCLISLVALTYAYGIAAVSELKTNSLRGWIENRAGLIRTNSKSAAAD